MPEQPSVPGLWIDPHSRVLRVDGILVDVTASEWVILSRLAQERGVVVTTHDLHGVLEDSWGDDTAIAVHISRIRRKLGDSARRPRFIETVHGIGYRMLPAYLSFELHYGPQMLLIDVTPRAPFLGWEPDAVVGTFFLLEPRNIDREDSLARARLLCRLGYRTTSQDSIALAADGSRYIAKVVTTYELDSDGDYAGVRGHVTIVGPAE